MSQFQYLGCNITYQFDDAIQIKINRFQAICGTINRTLGRKTRKETQMKFYKVMAIPTLLYGSEKMCIRDSLQAELILKGKQ